MRQARAVLGMTSTWVCLGALACSDGPADRAQVYAGYEGVYAIERVDRFVDSCAAEGASVEYEAHPNMWVAILTEDQQKPILEGTGCKDVAFCQAVAAQLKQGKPPPQGYYDFEHLTYSWVGVDESPRGWGYLMSSRDGACHKDLEQYFIRRQGEETLFDTQTREGLTYAATASGSCDPDPEVEPESLLQNRCLLYEVIRTRFVSAL